MRLSILLAATLAFCASASTSFASESIYRTFKAGMSPETVVKTIEDRGGEKPIFDKIDTRFSSIYGSVPSSSKLPPATGWFLFDNKRLSAVLFEYIVPPRGTSPEENKAVCDAEFAAVRADVESAYGPPTSTTDEKVGSQQRTRLKWKSPEHFKLTSQYVNGENCGSIRTLLFDGSEAEFRKRAHLRN